MVANLSHKPVHPRARFTSLGAVSLLGSALGATLLWAQLAVGAIASTANRPDPPASAGLKTAEEIPESEIGRSRGPAAAGRAATEPAATEAEAAEAVANEGQAPRDSLPQTEMAEISEPDGTTVILPPGYRAERQYPALVLMPYTDRTALHMFNWGIYEAYHQKGSGDFIIIMPPGQGSSANWSGWGWEAFVEEYEAYVQQNLNSLVEKYNVDPSQLVVGGFSLGGDLSWTLSLRNPDLFRGAIVLGAMSTYRDEGNAQRLANRGFRYYMVMGSYDGNRSAMYSALDALEAHRIAYHYEEVGAAGHGDLPEQMQPNLFLSAMDYVLSGEIAFGTPPLVNP